MFFFLCYGDYRDLHSFPTRRSSDLNNSFRDHYLGVPFDLSNVMFICTANLTDTIQPAFLDRMEVLRLSGYTEDEKVEIARRHILPKQLEEQGITPENLEISENAVRLMMNSYTREAGL